MVDVHQIVLGMEGSEIHIKCELLHVLYWTKDNTSISKAQYSQWNGQNLLILTNTNQSDTGLYTCHGTNPNNTEKQTETTHLMIGSK